MTLEHATLPLGGETIKKEKESEKHDSCPSGGCLLSINVVPKSDLQIVCRCHEHSDTNTDAKRNPVVVLRVYSIRKKVKNVRENVKIEDELCVSA